MGIVDTRQEVDMRLISALLLKVAENPLAYVDFNSEEVKKGLPFQEEVAIAASLARQASASVISNCVIELWSATVSNLHALEPEFPLYPSSVIKFISTTRLSFLSYVSLYYSICGNKFEGSHSYEIIKTIIDLRHEIQHDKPEPNNNRSHERIERLIKWQHRLEPLVGKDNLLWLPKIQYNHDKPAYFQLGGEPIVMKFMKYTVAKWAYDATAEVTKDMHAMWMHDNRRKVKLVNPDISDFDQRLTSDKDLFRLWQSGE